MSLSIGSQVTAETLGWQLTIQKKLGEGGQGVAYLARGPGGDLVVKWYNAEQATDAQRQAIRQLVKDGPPTGLAGKRFVWPLDVVTAPQSRQSGAASGVGGLIAAAQESAHNPPLFEEESHGSAWGDSWRFDLSHREPTTGWYAA